MKPFTPFLLALCLLIPGTLPAQMPQAAPLPVRAWYFSAQAWDTGTGYSPWCNEVASTNRSLQLAWTPSLTPGTVTLIGAGRSSGSYTITNCAGTNATMSWPLSPPFLNTIISWGDYPLITNPPSPSFFSQYTTTNDGGAYVAINYSTNLIDWVVDWKLIPNNGGLFTFTKTP